MESRWDSHRGWVVAAGVETVAPMNDGAVFMDLRTSVKTQRPGDDQQNLIGCGRSRQPIKPFRAGPPVSAANPNGIESSSPGLPAAGYPGKRAHHTPQP